jgi:hypothetical protein
MRLTALLALISASYATARLNPTEGSLSREEKKTVGKVTFESDEELRDYIIKRESTTTKSQVNKKKDQVGLSVSKGDLTCKDSPEGWFDSGGATFDCRYYEKEDKCDDWGNIYAGVDGKVANEACCSCGGGETSICTDSPMGWFDGLGSKYNCIWYAQDNNCETYGNDTPNFGKTANEACCACGGGSTSSDDPVCSDTIDGWVDSLGDSCDWYAGYSEVDRCYLYGNGHANQGATANEVCCVCGGGSGGNNDPFSGYDFYANLDSSGGDISNSDQSSISEFAEECDALSNCKGFNTNGWLKHTIKPGRQWTTLGSNPEDGLYVKKTEFESLTKDETEKLKNVSKKDRDEIKSFDDLKKYVAKAE